MQLVDIIRSKNFKNGKKTFIILFDTYYIT